MIAVTDDLVLAMPTDVADEPALGEAGLFDLATGPIWRPPRTPSLYVSTGRPRVRERPTLIRLDEGHDGTVRGDVADQMGGAWCSRRDHPRGNGTTTTHNLSMLEFAPATNGSSLTSVGSGSGGSSTAFGNVEVDLTPTTEVVIDAGEFLRLTYSTGAANQNGFCGVTLRYTLPTL